MIVGATREIGSRSELRGRSKPEDYSQGQSFFLRRKLRSLQLLVRGYLAVQFVAWLVMALLALFWATYWVDRWWQLPLELRQFLGVGLAGGFLGWGAWSWGRSIFRRLGLPQLALLVERVRPEFDELLVTAAELVDRSSDGSGGENPYRAAFIRQVLAEAENRIVTLRIARVLNFRPLIRRSLFAVFWMATVVVYSLYAPEEVSVWAARWLRLQDQSWPLRTGIVLEGFYRGELVVPKGQPVEIAAAVDVSMPQVPRVLRVRLEDPTGLRRDLWMLREGFPAGGPFQRHVVRLSELFDVTTVSLAGGDCRLTGLTIVPRDFPGIPRVVARCEYPRYLRRSAESLGSASLFRVPEGTAVEIQMAASRPVVVVRVERQGKIWEQCPPEWREVYTLGQELENIFRDFLRNGEWKGLASRMEKLLPRLERSCKHWERFREVPDRGGSGLGPQGSDRDSNFGFVSPQGLAPIGFAEDLVSRAKSLILELQRQPGDSRGSERVSAWRIGQRFREILAAWESFAEKTAESLAYGEFSYDLGPVLEPEELRVWLTDVEGIATAHPIPISVVPVKDQAPKLGIDLQGVGPAVTPQARIRFVGDVEDDHGLARIEVLFGKSGGGTPEPAKQLSIVLSEFSDPVSRYSLNTVVDLSPLGLAPGEKLRLQVRASDWYDLGEQPNTGESAIWVLEVVTAEQLRLLLEKREISLRQQLDQIIVELQDLRRFVEEAIGSTLQAREGSVSGDPTNLEGGDSAAGRQSDDQREPVGEGEARSGPIASDARRWMNRVEEQMTKNAHELRAVLAGVRQIRQELVQNRLDAAAWMERLELRVEPPLSEAVENQFPKMISLVSREKEALDSEETNRAGDNREWLLSLASSVERTIGLLAEARDAMLELEDIRRATEMLRQIIEAQQDTLEATREEHRRRLRGIFQGRP